MKKLILKNATKPFSIASVCREDMLQAGISRKNIAKFTDVDMERLANKLGNAYMNVFWIDLSILAEEMLED